MSAPAPTYGESQPIFTNRQAALRISSLTEGLVGLPCIDAVGSRTIMGAARPDSDYDILVSGSPDWTAEFMERLQSEGFKLDGSGHYEPSEGQFNSWRKADTNIVLTYRREFAERFRVANRICQRFCIAKRERRVQVFQAVLYDRWPSRVSAWPSLGPPA